MFVVCLKLELLPGFFLKAYAWNIPIFLQDVSEPNGLQDLGINDKKSSALFWLDYLLSIITGVEWMLVYLRSRERRERKPGWLKSHNSSYNYLELQMGANLFGFASLLFGNPSFLIIKLLTALNNPSRVGTITLCNIWYVCKPLWQNCILSV